MGRSQLHKQRIQGVRSDGSSNAVTVANALVDQTSSADVADSYQFASNSFSTPAAGGDLDYEAFSVVSSVQVPLVAGITFNHLTRTFNWTKAAGTYVVRVIANNNQGQTVSDDFSIVAT